MVRNFYIPAGSNFKAESVPPRNYVLHVAFGGNNEQTQREYFDRARELHKIRPKTAHGDKLAENEEAAAVQVVERWTPEAETLARECLRRMFDTNLAQTFNSRNLHEALLIELLFQPNLDAAIGRLAESQTQSGRRSQ
jgi:hypothetical protein